MNNHYHSELTEFLGEITKFGYVKSTIMITRYLWQYPILRRNISRIVLGTSSGGSKGSIKYSALDLFGNDKDIYYYDPYNTLELTKYLTELFLTKNPSPPPKLKHAFTYWMRGNNLEPDYEVVKNKELSVILGSSLLIS